MAFVDVKSDSDNLVHLVYLDHKVDNNIASIVYKLDQVANANNHIVELLIENKDDLNNFVNVLVNYFSRMKPKKVTYTNGINKKTKDVKYFPGTIFSFVRNFRGYYELTDQLDEYTIGFCLVDKGKLLKKYDASKFTKKITVESFKMMQSRLNKLNRDYVVRIDQLK